MKTFKSLIEMLLTFSSISAFLKLYMLPKFQRNGCPILCMIIASLFFSACNESKTDTRWFRGEIVYAYSYESEELNVDSLTKIKPYKGVFRYDFGNYQSQFIGKDTFTYYYVEEINMCASRMNSEADFECEDYSTPTDSIINFSIDTTDVLISGNNCHLLEYQSGLFSNKYYFSRNLKLHPNTYNKHQAYNWKFYGEKAEGGLILKLEHKFKRYTMKGIVSSIRHFTPEENALTVENNVLKKACGVTD